MQTPNEAGSNDNPPIKKSGSNLDKSIKLPFSELEVWKALAAFIFHTQRCTEMADGWYGFEAWAAYPAAEVLIIEKFLAAYCEPDGSIASFFKNEGIDPDVSILEALDAYLPCGKRSGK